MKQGKERGTQVGEGARAGRGAGRAGVTLWRPWHDWKVGDGGLVEDGQEARVAQRPWGCCAPGVRGDQGGLGLEWGSKVRVQAGQAGQWDLPATEAFALR